MIILENYRKTEKLLRKLSGLSKGFGFTVTVSNGIEDVPSEEEALKLEVLELTTKGEALEGENTTLTENNTQLVSELETSKSEALELKSKFEELDRQLHSVVEEPKLKATEVAELIAKCESLEDLKQYEEDSRQVVKAAYTKKVKELE